MIDLLLDALSVYRLTRLVTRDTITRPLRVRIIRWAYRHDPRHDDGVPGFTEWNAKLNPVLGAVTESEIDALPENDEDAPKLAALLICPWCISIYAATAVVLARRLAPRAWEPAARMLALSATTGFLAGLDD